MSVSAGAKAETNNENDNGNTESRAAASRQRKSLDGPDRVVSVQSTRSILRDLARLRTLFDRIREGQEKGVPLSTISLKGAMNPPVPPGGAGKTDDAEYRVPVFHTFLIKELRDDGDGGHPLMVGTFVQHIFGLPFDDPDEGSKAPNEAFNYMFNYNSAGGEMEFRREECHRVKLPSSAALSPPPDASSGTRTSTATNPPPPPPPEGSASESDFVPLTRYTYHVRARMRMNSEFDQFPFTVFRGVVRVELDSRNSGTRIGGGTPRFVPRLMLHAHDSRNNICLQELKGGIGGTGIHGSFRWNRPKFKEHRQRQMESFEQMLDRRAEGGDVERVRTLRMRMAEEAVRNKLDEMSRFAIISPFPEVTYSYDKKEYCQTFFVSFWLVEEGIPKFIRVIVPMILVAALNSVNVIILISKSTKETNQKNAAEAAGVEKEEQDLGDFVDETVNYLNTAVTLGLTAVFLLPSIGESRNNREGLSMNDLYVFLVFLGLALSSLPPALIGTNGLGIFGMSVLWVSFVIPGWNLFAYRILIGRIKNDRRAASEKHKFLKDEDMKKWKPKPSKAKQAGHTPLEEFVYVKDCIGAEFDVGQEEVPLMNEDDAFRQESTHWELARHFYDVDQISKSKFEISY